MLITILENLLCNYLHPRPLENLLWHHLHPRNPIRHKLHHKLFQLPKYFVNF